MDFLLDLFFPPRCIFCSAILPQGGGRLCPSCTKNLPFVEDRKVLRKIGKYTCAVTFYYDDPVTQGIRALKFRSRQYRAHYFANYLAQTVAEHLGGEFDAVTYVPVHFVRRFRRGFDQSKLLAKATAEIWGVNLLSTLRKTRNNPPQSTVKDPEARRKNVQNAYSVIDPHAFRGKRLLLIDDVVTSGNTLIACADELLAAGAASVVCAALAGGHSEKNNGNLVYSPTIPGKK